MILALFYRSLYMNVYSQFFYPEQISIMSVTFEEWYLILRKKRKVNQNLSK